MAPVWSEAQLRNLAEMTSHCIDAYRAGLLGREDLTKLELHLVDAGVGMSKSLDEHENAKRRYNGTNVIPFPARR